MNRRSKHAFSVSNLVRVQTGLFLTAAALNLSTLRAEAAPAHPLRNVQTLFDLGGKGNSYFNSEMRAEVRKAGFRFVRSRKVADATLSSSGYWRKNRAFAGTVTIRDLRGRILWTTTVNRQPTSRVMAFESIARQLRAAR